MYLSRSCLLAAALALGTQAQRPSNVPICDYYTTALFMNNTSANQLTLLTALVNTAVIGSFPVAGVNTTGNVSGILTPGMVNQTQVNLLPYFDGGFASTNRGGMSGISMNFLDGGGADPLMKLMPANDTTSNQYLLLTHLYSYFGSLLGCTMEGSGTFPAYTGQSSQYKVHKFMDLSYAQVTYFITQVASSAAYFGVASADIDIVGKALNSLFNVRCGPEVDVVPGQDNQLQSICIQSDCPLAANSTCASYQNVTMPSVAIASLVPNTTSTMSGTATGTSTAGGSKNTASSAGRESLQKGLLAGVLGLLALLL